MAVLCITACNYPPEEKHESGRLLEGPDYLGEEVRNPNILLAYCSTIKFIHQLLTVQIVAQGLS